MGLRLGCEVEKKDPLKVTDRFAISSRSAFSRQLLWLAVLYPVS